MKILIVTGIYPPQIGGPAEYARSLSEAFRSIGHTVTVCSFDAVLGFPTGIRHAVFFFKLLPAVYRADVVIGLDTFSVALPSVIAARLLSRNIILRTGGDFLWESYVERTKQKVLLREFYTKERSFTFRERIVFHLTKFVLHRASAVVFSTAWQRAIWEIPYNLGGVRTSLIENYYGPKEESEVPSRKVFLAATRPLVWKNHDMLRRAFMRAKEVCPDIALDEETVPFGVFMEKMKRAYAVVLVSLGDISPNMILDAIRHSKPFILTKENGLRPRIGDLGLSVDPQEEVEIADALVRLTNEEVYRREKMKVEAFSFRHSYEDIAKEFLGVFRSLK